MDEDLYTRAIERAKAFNETLHKQITYEEDRKLGGNKCHLCGASKLTVDSHNTWDYKKDGELKRSHIVNTITYRCGTEYRTTTGFKEKDSATTLVGPECIKVG